MGIEEDIRTTIKEHPGRVAGAVGTGLGLVLTLAACAPAAQAQGTTATQQGTPHVRYGHPFANGDRVTGTFDGKNYAFERHGNELVVRYDGETDTFEMGPGVVALESYSGEGNDLGPLRPSVGADRYGKPRENPIFAARDGLVIRGLNGQEMVTPYGGPDSLKASALEIGPNGKVSAVIGVLGVDANGQDGTYVVSALR